MPLSSDPFYPLLPWQRTRPSERFGRSDRLVRFYLQQVVGFAVGGGIGGRSSSLFGMIPSRPSRRIAAVTTSVPGFVGVRPDWSGPANSDAVTTRHRMMPKNLFMLTSVWHGRSTLARMVARAGSYISRRGMGGTKSTGRCCVILSMYVATDAARSLVSNCR